MGIHGPNEIVNHKNINMSIANRWGIKILILRYLCGVGEKENVDTHAYTSLTTSSVCCQRPARNICILGVLTVDSRICYA